MGEPEVEHEPCMREDDTPWEDMFVEANILMAADATYERLPGILSSQSVTMPVAAWQEREDRIAGLVAERAHWKGMTERLTKVLMDWEMKRPTQPVVYQHDPIDRAQGTAPPYAEPSPTAPALPSRALSPDAAPPGLRVPRGF